MARRAEIVSAILENTYLEARAREVAIDIACDGIEAIEQIVGLVRAEAGRNDEGAATANESTLMLATLAAIAAGADGATELARAALQTQTIIFSRY